MEMEALMPRQPGADFGMLVGGVIVNDQMHVPLSRGLAVDRIEKADELLMPVAAHALADDLAVEDVERRTGSWCRGVCNHGSSCRNDRASSAVPAGCGQVPGFGSSHRPTAPGHALTD